ncbi:putative transmembrane protein INAFM2 isoform X2 [Hyposmocoma kahamanoa]|uniref:putative transmembrane protein INAFM2 isoform X2 n=1 Tax=Hyposmocoma kahamanoa TaxID=1477025 RepID=UPI000E6D5DB8|nr:putative transmembrane protein INAFM2 isoform X2 [Hyposmocoma kahamanoa]
MSVCGQTDDDSVSEEPPGAPVREMYEQKAVSKVVRVLTVLAYLLSVSLAAILLSVYYVCVWKPVNLNDTEPKTDAQVAPNNVYSTEKTLHLTLFNAAGGGNTSMSDTTSSTPNYTSLETNAPADSPPTSTDFSPTPMDFNLTWATENNTIIDSGPT